ncbi:diguanylate cyclase (GGDEF) and hemerythrin-like metal-binding domain-containing protein [Desulfocapsa sulfexigens DSM 10523]|uniref:diguanylate cyclase n=1 Tax=Desulfocapsa sulfexigens (strain DSM 10523 / SB164P1) TaxID=1167006 RepID=M1P5C2_DESSD|nr:GGDEF domain-containing protein [Desulfocapsa sulfexigens]AGF76892.1 diguanylate cyclase (GGDEF) and hemerythrin-like metal-binding domain-containing protein [Desulfocapsa sulfexigens DSM 10523]
MDSFHWTKTYETGLSEVDLQHHYLVDTINEFGRLLLLGQVASDDVEQVFKKLADYTQYHFTEEEIMMKQVGIDARHYKEHCKKHQDFLDEVISMYAAVSEDNPGSEKHLFDFLTHWLVYHILGADMNMARQIKAIQSGVTSAAAYENEERAGNEATEPLLIALNGLFEQVSVRNRELLFLNQSLEEKVAERTRELSEANRHLEELSLTDVLTGLPNRRYALRSLDLLWREAVRTNSPMVCMMIDADHFKAVNDTYGHDAGDAVLSKLAQTLQHSLRNDDIVSRLGGDEFFIICPNTDIVNGMNVAESIRKAVSELRVTTGDGIWHGSVSVGVAAFTPGMATYDELMKVADQGVYAAKQDGKNCVRSCS